MTTQETRNQEPGTRNQLPPQAAVLGCGYWGKNLVRNLNSLGALAAVADPTEAGRAKAKELAPDARVVEDPAVLLADPAIQAVFIATPAETHFELGMAVLAAGKDLYLEKPLALTHERGARLVREAEARGRLLMVGHILQYHPAVLTLNRLVQSGELGRIQYIYSNRLNLGKIRREENILWSFAPHDISVILMLLGGQLPFEVIAVGGAYLQPNIADTTVTHLLFDNGVRAHIYVSWLHPFKEQKLVVVGDRKMAVFDDVKKEDKLVLLDEHVELHDSGELLPVKGEGTPVAYEWSEPLRAECAHFLECVATRQTPRTDGQEGLRVLAVLQAAQRSLITQGQPVILPVELGA